VLALLNLDVFGETFVPRSRAIDFLLAQHNRPAPALERLPDPNPVLLHRGEVLDSIRSPNHQRISH
jgi:hypothetical protein